MLSLISGSTGVAKQINVVSQTSSQVMYTVPAGKRFKGFASSNAGTSQAGVSINGANLLLANASPMPLELTAGTVVACAYAGSVSLIGVEQ